MSGMSDRIETFILELLKDDSGWLELGRNELASVFNCVPSQINYVISTRFTPDRGYVVESKRGGGGYMKIRRIINDENNLIHNCISSIGDEIDYASADNMCKKLYSYDIIGEKMYNLITSAVCEKSIPKNTAGGGELRAKILKNMIITLL